MTPLFSFHRHKDAAERRATETEVLRAGDDFARKESLVDRFSFLPSEMNRAAKDTALSRFLEILLSHMRR